MFSSESSVENWSDTHILLAISIHILDLIDEKWNRLIDKILDINY